MSQHFESKGEMTEREVGWESEEGGRLAAMLVALGYTENEAQEVKAVLSKFTLRRLEAGEVLVNEGDAGDFAYVVHYGRLGIFKRMDDGTETKLATAAAGSMQGEIAVIGSLPRLASVRAEESSEVFKFSKLDFRKLLTTSLRFQDRVDALLAKRLEELP